MRGVYINFKGNVSYPEWDMSWNVELIINAPPMLYNITSERRCNRSLTDYIWKILSQMFHCLVSLFESLNELKCFSMFKSFTLWHWFNFAQTFFFFYCHGKQHDVTNWTQFNSIIDRNNQFLLMYHYWQQWKALKHAKTTCYYYYYYHRFQSTFS